jgi:hypothetical protein
VAVAAAVLQLLSIFITVLGFCSNSSSSMAYVMGSSLTMVTMGVATAAIVSEIEDGNTEAANTRNSRAPSTYTGVLTRHPCPGRQSTCQGCLQAV